MKDEDEGHPILRDRLLKEEVCEVHLWYYPFSVLTLEPQMKHVYLNLDLY